MQALGDVKHDWEYTRDRREMELGSRHQGGLKMLTFEQRLGPMDEELPASITYLSERARKQGRYR